MDRRQLEAMSRAELLAVAERLGVERPRVLTRDELIDEALRRSTRPGTERTRARGWLGRARDLLASVVEHGLHLPEAAKALRPAAEEPPPPAVATVTLASIYAAQGHLTKAITILDDVLSREPGHGEAAALRERLQAQASAPPEAPLSSGSERHVAPPASLAVAHAAEAAQAPAPLPEPAPADEPPSASNLPLTPATEQTMQAAEAAPPVATAESAEEAEPQAAAAPTAVLAPTEPAVALDSQAPATTTEGTEAEPAAAERAPAEPATEVADAAAAEPGPIEPAQPAAEAAAPAAAPATEAAPAPRAPEAGLDEVVALAVEPDRVFVYWEASEPTLARIRAEEPEGALVLRLLAVTGTWDGPVSEVVDIAVAETSGDRYVAGLPAGANVRLSLGWLSAKAFEPIAVGSDLATPRAVPSAPSTTRGTWSTPAPLPDVATPLRPIVQAALARARGASAATEATASIDALAAPFAASQLASAPKVTSWYEDAFEAPSPLGGGARVVRRVRTTSHASRAGGSWGGASELVTWTELDEQLTVWGGASDLALGASNLST